MYPFVVTAARAAVLTAYPDLFCSPKACILRLASQIPSLQLRCRTCLAPFRSCCCLVKFNTLTPNDPYRGRTAPLTSKRCILYIYSTDIGTEYFKHGIYSPFFSLSSKCSLFHNSNIFGSCFIHILYTGCAKI